MRMPVARCTREPSDQDVRTKGPDYAHHVSHSNVMTSPFLKCLLGCFGEAKIGHARESLLDSVVLISREELQSTQHAKFVGECITRFVLTALPPRQSTQERGRSLSTRFQREHAAIFIVWVSSGVHKTGCGAQSLQLLLQGNVAMILRENGLLRTERRRGGEKTDENEWKRKFAKDDWFEDHRFLKSSRFSSAATRCGFIYVRMLGRILLCRARAVGFELPMHGTKCCFPHD